MRAYESTRKPPRKSGGGSVEVSFQRPIVLPATVAFGEASSDEGLRFVVRDERKRTPHLDGSVKFS